MDADDLLNSSDIEFDDAPANPFAGAGKDSIEAIIANATEDRITSKKFSKQLTFTKGRPGTQYRNMLWYNRFQTYRQHSLQVSSTENPTGQQIERFLASIVSRVNPKGHAVPSFDWLKGGFRHLLLALVFHHSYFTLSRHDTTRISTAVQKLLQDGRLTREPARERNWVGTFILRKVATAMLHDALDQGTMNWDVTMSRIASLVLTAALSARAGDLATDPLDEQPLPYLCYKDITMKFVGGQEIEHLEAAVVIRNEKSKKGNPHHNRTPRLSCLKDTADNILCPIKLILIIALRSGNIDGADSIEKAVKLAQARKSQTILWTHPEKPVICAIISRAKGLLPEKAANRTQITKSLAEGGMLARVIASLASHDLRYGAARDTANISGKIKGLPSADVAATLGHSKRSLDKGITAKYVGAMSTDIWASRVKEDFHDPFGPSVSEIAPLAKRRRLSPAELTSLCKEQGLDSSDKKARARAGYADKQKRKKDWIKAASARNDSVDLEEKEEEEEEEEEEEREGEREDEEPATPIKDGDGVSVNEAINLENCITGSSDAVMTERVEEAIFADMVNTPSDVASGYSQLDFIQKFSSINITSNQSLVRPKRRTVNALGNITGNSRDNLSFFTFPCKNAARGCQYRNASRVVVTAHERFCPVDRRGKVRLRDESHDDESD